MKPSTSTAAEREPTAEPREKRARRSDWPRLNGQTNEWWFVVDAGVDPRTGKRRQIRRTGFTAKKKAADDLTRLRAALLEGTFVDRSTVTLRDYLDGWLDALRSQLRANTLASYRRTLEQRVYPRLGSRRLQSLVATDLDRLYAHLLDSGRVVGTGGLAPRSVRYVHAILSHALSDAERKGLVARNVARHADPPSPRDRSLARHHDASCRRRGRRRRFRRVDR